MYIHQLQDAVKVYYPFLRTPSGIKRFALDQDLRRIIGYLFLADRVILPPRDFLTSGIYQIYGYHGFFTRFLNVGLERDKIIFSTSNSSITDLYELEQFYTPIKDNTRRLITNRHLALKNLGVYHRDAPKMADAYIEHFRSRMHERLPPFVADEAKKIVERDIYHENIIKSLNDSGLLFHNPKNIMTFLNECYREGGRIGNGAKLPSERRKAPILAWDPLYGDVLIDAFVKRLQNQLGKDLLALSPEQIFAISDQLENLHVKWSEINDKISNISPLDQFRFYENPILYSKLRWAIKEIVKIIMTSIVVLIESIVTGMIGYGTAISLIVHIISEAAKPLEYLSEKIKKDYKMISLDNEILDTYNKIIDTAKWARELQP